MPKNNSLIKEFLYFVRLKKAWWLVPVIIMLFLVGILLIFSQSTALSPFVYVLF